VRHRGSPGHDTAKGVFHLAVLKDAGLLKDRKQGKWTHYSIADTDMFRRFLLLSTLERISAETVSEDIRRLQDF